MTGPAPGRSVTSHLTCLEPSSQGHNYNHSYSGMHNPRHSQLHWLRSVLPHDCEVKQGEVEDGL